MKVGGVDYCFQKHKINSSIIVHGIMKVLKEVRSINDDELHLTSIFKA